MSTVKEGDGKEIIPDDVSMKKAPIKVAEVKAIIKQADAEEQKLTDADVRNVNVEGNGKNVTVDAGTKQDHPGRPIDTTSKRQQELLKRELKRQMGLLRKGRPVDIKSERQVRLHELAEKREAGLLKPGRPAYTEEQRKQAEKDKEARHEARMVEIRAMAAELLAKQGAEPKVD